MLFSIIVYSLLSFIIFFIIINFSYRLNLIDIPSQRKIHLRPTVYTGGIALIIIYLISFHITNFNHNYFYTIIILGLVISIVGFIDDKYNLNFKLKILLQIIPILYLIFFEKFILYDIGNYNYFKTDLKNFSSIYTLLCVLLLVNAFNYFDGIDGSLSFSVISVIIILFFLTREEDFIFFFVILLIPIIIFLFFNFSLFKLPKVFLGDSGSLLLGFIISFVLIFLANQKIVHPILLAWSVVVFVYEFLSVNIVRLKNKKKIFKASNDHLHHLLLKKNNSIILTNLIIFIINIILFSIGYFSFELFGPLVSLVLFKFLFIIFLSLRNFYFINENI